MTDTSNLESRARHHAQLTRSRYAAVVPPPVEQLVRRPARSRRRGTGLVAAAAAVCMVGVWSLLGQPHVPGDVAGSSTQTEPEQTESQHPTGADSIQLPGRPHTPPQLQDGWGLVGEYQVSTTDEAHVGAEDDNIILIVTGGTYRLSSDGTMARVADAPTRFPSACCMSLQVLGTEQGVVAVGGHRS